MARVTPEVEWIILDDGVILDRLVPHTRSPAERLAAWAVAVKIAAHCDKHGTAFPSLATIAAALHVDPSAVSRAVGVLQRAGVLVVERKPGRSNVYRFAEPQPSSLSTSPAHRPDVRAAVAGIADAKALDRDDTHGGRHPIGNPHSVKCAGCRDARIAREVTKR